MTSLSSELVPSSYTRTVYNQMQGTELPSHTSLLNAEQAQRINDHYDIEVYTGQHGLTLDAAKAMGVPPEHAWRFLPGQKEYSQVAGILDTMQPGDTLLVEGRGFIWPQLRPYASVLPELLASDPDIKSSEEVTLTALKVLALKREELEEERNNYKINAGQYAIELARLKGIDVVRADSDAVVTQSWEPLTQDRTLEQLMSSPNEEDRALAQRLNGRREQDACNTTKDRALEGLREKESVLPEGARKPKLVLLFGDVHNEGLREKFDDMGLEATVTSLEMSTVEERATEQFKYLMSKRQQPVAA